jgi:hypothetical protein
MLKIDEKELIEHALLVASTSLVFAAPKSFTSATG